MTVTDDKHDKSDADAVADILEEARAIELEERLAAMSDEEVSAHLAKAGVTEADLDESAVRERELYEKAKSTTPRHDNVVDIRSRRRRDVIVVGSTLGLAASFALVMMAAGAMTVAIGAKPTPTETVTAATAATAGADLPAQARDLRFQAFREFALGYYQDCIKHFDEAKALDPTGDKDLAIVGTRATATSMLEMRDH
jgi:hypothetical protein